MSELQTITFEPHRVRAELGRFGALLATNTELSVQSDVLPFLKACPQIVSFIGITFGHALPADRCAFGFDVFGARAADLLVGSQQDQAFCVVAFEEAHAGSVIREPANGERKEWGRPLERGFGHLLDCFYALEEQKHSAAFKRIFGPGYTQFSGLLLVGRSAHLTEEDRERLRWRSEHVVVSSHQVTCWTYDELFAALNHRLQQYEQFAQSSEGAA